MAVSASRSNSTFAEALPFNFDSISHAHPPIMTKRNYRSVSNDIVSYLVLVLLRIKLFGRFSVIRDQSIYFISSKG